MNKVSSALIKLVAADPMAPLGRHAEVLIADNSLTEEDWKEAGLGATFRQTKEEVVLITWADYVMRFD